MCSYRLIHHNVNTIKLSFTGRSTLRSIGSSYFRDGNLVNKINTIYYILTNPFTL